LSRSEKAFWLIVGALLVIGFIFLIPAYQQVCEQGKEANQKDCPSYHVALVALRHVAEFFDVHNWLIGALFAGLVTLFTWRLWQATAGLKDSTDKLWRAGDRQMELIEASAAEQSRDMLASIAAAVEANRINSEGFDASQRAWVSAECVTASDFVWDKAGGHLTIETTVKNIGSAPAQDVNIQVKIYAMTKSRMEGRIAEVMNEPLSTAVGHLLFPNGDVAPNTKLTLTREQIDEFMSQSDSNNSLRKDVTINVAVIVRYLSTMDRREARTIKFYDLKMLPYEEAEIAYPIPINIDQDVPQARLSLTHHWMPSYAN
jgi:hypothetical protein